jgi:hypothetical protein
MFVRQEALAKPPFASQEQWQLLRDEAAPVPSTAEAVASRYSSIPGGFGIGAGSKPLSLPYDCGKKHA